MTHEIEFTFFLGDKKQKLIMDIPKYIIEMSNCIEKEEFIQTIVEKQVKKRIRLISYEIIKSIK